MAPKSTSQAYSNRLAPALSPSDLASLSPDLTAVSSNQCEELGRPNKPIENCLFPEAHIVSVVATGTRKQQLEIGIIGREGMTGLMAVQGDHRSPYSAYPQVDNVAAALGKPRINQALRMSELRSLVGACSLWMVTVFVRSWAWAQNLDNFLGIAAQMLQEQQQQHEEAKQLQLPNNQRWLLIASSVDEQEAVDYARGSN